jgi:hypothetical protein
MDPGPTMDSDSVGAILSRIAVINEEMKVLARDIGAKRVKATKRYTLTLVSKPGEPTFSISEFTIEEPSERILSEMDCSEVISDKIVSDSLECHTSFTPILFTANFACIHRRN